VSWQVLREIKQAMTAEKQDVVREVEEMCAALHMLQRM
jgi:hypothetical protein